MAMLYIALIIFSCIVIWRVSDSFEVASDYLGRNLSEGVRGATINAIGSSIPELLTTLFFLFYLHDRDGFAGGIGTTAGSALFNGMVIPAIVILVVVGIGWTKSIAISRKVILRDGLTLIFAELILIFVISENTLELWHGLILMGIYVGYIAYMLGTMKWTPPNDTSSIVEKKPTSSLLKAFITLDLERLIIGHRTLKNQNAWLLLVVTTIVMGVACFLLVHACEALGVAIGVPVYFVAVILASMATSVPDTILSVKDARRGNYDDAVSNALGSNIFDICFALGAPLFIYIAFYGPITMSVETVQNVTELRLLLLLLTILAFLIYFVGRGMGQIKAYSLLGLYALFVLYILGRANDSTLATFIAEQLGYMTTVLDTVRFW